VCVCVFIRTHDPRYADKAAVRWLKGEAKRRFLEEVRIETIPLTATLSNHTIKGNQLHTGGQVSRRHESNDNKAPGTLAERQAAKRARVDQLSANRGVMRDQDDKPELHDTSQGKHRKIERDVSGSPPSVLAGAPAARIQRYGKFAAKMMAKMGYKEGEGLGKASAGVIEPISVSKLDRGTGLG
jgi:hypothetical protein